jgi:predicted SpoU family rRNA methylase
VIANVISSGNNVPIFIQFDAKHNISIDNVTNSNIAKNRLTLDVITKGLSSFLYQKINNGIWII